MLPHGDSCLQAEAFPLARNQPEAQFADDAATVELAHLQGKLSASAFHQLMRLRNVDFSQVDYDHLEKNFSQVLGELDRVETLEATLLRTVIELKRSESVRDNRIEQLEGEIKNTRSEFRDLMQPVKATYANAQGELRKEHRTIERFKEHLAGRLDTVEASLAKAERGLTVLQTHWTKHRHTFEELVQNLAPTQELAASLDSRLLDMERLQETVWGLLKGLQEEVQGLTRADTPGDEGVGQGSLEAELVAIEGDDFVVPGEARHKPTRCPDGWYYSEPPVPSETGTPSSFSVTDAGSHGREDDQDGRNDEPAVSSTSDDGSFFVAPDLAVLEVAGDFGGPQEGPAVRDPADTDRVTAEPSHNAANRAPGYVQKIVETARDAAGPDAAAALGTADTTTTNTLDPAIDLPLSSILRNALAGLSELPSHRASPEANEVKTVARAVSPIHLFFTRYLSGVVERLSGIHPSLPYVVGAVQLPLAWFVASYMWQLGAGSSVSPSSSPSPPPPPSEHPIWDWACSRT